MLFEINSHFGTSFTGWFDNEFYRNYGDLIPDWSEYERFAEKTYLKAHINYVSKDYFLFGYLVFDSVFHWNVYDSEFAILALSNGIIDNDISPLESIWNQYLYQGLQQYGNIESYEIVIDASLVPDSYVPGWEFYELIE